MNRFFPKKGKSLQGRKRHKELTVSDKQKLIMDHDTGLYSAEDLERKYNISKVTRWRILKKRKNITEIMPSGNGRKRSCLKRTTKPTLESMVMELIRKARGYDINISVTRFMIMMVAKRVKERLLAGENSTAISAKELKSLKSFEPTPTWAKRFTKRHSLISVKLHGCGNDVSLDDLKIQNQLRDIRIKIAEYPDLNTHYNVDEFGLFYNQIPDQSFILPEEDRKKARGGKRMRLKDRVTGIAASNATGSHIIPTAVIGKSANPRIFKANSVGPKSTLKNKTWSGLPLPYTSQKKAWSDSRVMKWWFNEVFRPAVEQRHGSRTKVLLLMDNCGSHTPDSLNEIFYTPHNNIEVVLLPPNTTSKLQPMDAGYIAFLKKRYKYKLLMKVMECVENWEQQRALAQSLKQGLKGLEHGHSANMLDMLNILASVQAQLTPTIVAKCWASCTPHIYPPPMHQQLLDVITSYQVTVDAQQEKPTQLLLRLSTLSIDPGPTEIDDNELVPALRTCQQVLSDPVHHEHVFSAWHDCDDKQLSLQ